MEFKPRTLSELADMICGNFDAHKTLFRYRSNGRLTEFFYDRGGPPVLSERRQVVAAGEHTEVESRKRNDRPELAKAFAQCKLTGSVLLVAKPDRLSRDACFLLGLEEADIEFVVCDISEREQVDRWRNGRGHAGRTAYD